MLDNTSQLIWENVPQLLLVAYANALDAHFCVTRALVKSIQRYIVDFRHFQHCHWTIERKTNIYVNDA